MGVTEILCSFKLVLERKAGKELPQSSRLEFLEKFLASSFGLSDSEENTYGLLNSGGIADFLLLKTLLAICQRSWKLSFWEWQTLLFYYHMDVWQLQEPFCND